MLQNGNENEMRRALIEIKIAPQRIVWSVISRDCSEWCVGVCVFFFGHKTAPKSRNRLKTNTFCSYIVCHSVPHQHENWLLKTHHFTAAWNVWLILATIALKASLNLIGCWLLACLSCRVLTWIQLLQNVSCDVDVVKHLRTKAAANWDAHDVDARQGFCSHYFSIVFVYKRISHKIV